MFDDLDWSSQPACCRSRPDLQRYAALYLDLVAEWLPMYSTPAPFVASVYPLALVCLSSPGHRSGFGNFLSALVQSHIRLTLFRHVVLRHGFVTPRILQVRSVEAQVEFPPINEAPRIFVLVSFDQFRPFHRFRLQSRAEHFSRRV